MSDRFDFEQEIMNCWNVTNDIELLIKRLDEHKINSDDLKTYLSGLKTIYDVKFNQLFDTFEYLIKQGNIK